MTVPASLRHCALLPGTCELALRSLFVSVVIALVVGAAGCGTQPSGPDPVDPPGSLGRLRYGEFSFPISYSRMTNSERLVIRDAAAWAQLWDRMKTGSPPVPRPDVDFTSEMLIVAALGERSDGRYSILIDSVAPDSTELRAVVRLITAGRGCVWTTAVTQPVDIVRVPRREASVRFEDRAEERACQ
jgi:hypothetical protein